MRRIWALPAMAAFAAMLVAGPAGDIRPVWSEPGANVLGTPSLDGRYVSCVDPKTGNLALLDVATGQRRPLTTHSSDSGEFAYFSTISPDGGQVAYAWFNEEKFYDLRVVGTDGSAPRVLYRNEEAGFVQPSAWSPDGKHILTLFFRKDNISQIALVSADDGSVRVLKSLNWVYPKKMDFSPDGRFIVYDNFQQDGVAERDIFVLATDGSREVRLVEHPATDLFPVWSPDGAKVLFASDRMGTMDAWTIAVTDGKPQGAPELLRRNLGRFLPMGITRAGDYYYGVRSGRTDVYVAALEPEMGKLAGNPTLATKRSPGSNSSPRWSPDGKRLAYFSRRGSENFGEASRVISILSVETGQERDLVPELAHMERFRWSPDGRWLLAGGSDRHGRGGLYRIDVRHAKATPLVQEESAGFRGLEGVWSSDGAAVIYAASGEIRRVELGDRKESVLYREAAGVRHLALSPDGKRLSAAFGDGRVQVWQDGEARPLARFEMELSGLEWTPDGRYLVVSAEGEGAWRILAEGGQPQKIAVAPSLNGGVSFHPDGRGVAFSAGRTKSEVWVMRNALAPLAEK